ncbi:hypothetical protein D5038_03705 [Verminephrobacter aporrectodeae subsp. tuberculatae]|uniref:SwmB domain-containing protein n=1 Tax=Verminephrobacter aporrectodeae TaxID=1110389 RepID=UPI002238FC48|nr:SwmB domain-containing protein [Verminephrobacter aporrectodeae]MCW5255499.1 hypothetical protein [Verminephrobacter aporrectodeae subsp. tuberculatae]
MTHWYYDQNPNKLVDITIADSTLTADETTTVTLYFDRYVQGSRPGWFGAVRIVPIGVLEVPAGTQLSGPWSLNMNRAWAFTLTPPADTAQTRQILRLKSLDGVTDGLRKTVAAADFRIEYTVNTQRPTLAGATVDRFQLVLSYTDAGSLDATNKAGVDAFTVHGASGSTIAVSSVHVDATAKTVTLFLARAVRNGELVSVSYTDPTSGNDSKAIQNAVGNDAASFSNQAVVNNTPTDSLRPRLSVTGHTIDDDRLGIGQTAYVTIKFSEPVKGFDASDVVLAPGSGSVGQVSAAWQPGTDGSSDTWEVAIEAPGASSTNNPISVNLAGVSTRDGSATGRGTMATGLHYSVDTTRPTLLGTRISYGAGETDTILKRGETALVSFTFSEPVTDFGLNDVMLVNGLRDGVLSYFTSTGDGSVWTATLSAPSPGVTSSNNTFRVIMRGVNDRAGNAGEGVVATGVSYDLDTIVGRPSLRITLANTELRVGESTTVTFRFNEAVTGFDANAVVLTNASGTLSDLAVGADGKTWSATFTPTASTQDASNTIRVNLSGVSNGAGLTGAGSVSSANYTVDTWSPDTEAPVLGGAMVNGNQLVLCYVEAGRLDAAALAGNAGYAVSSTTGTAITVSSAVVDTLAKTVTLTLSRAVTPAETVKVSYTKPESGAVVQDAAGNDAVSFSEQAVVNNSPPAEGSPRLPTLAASNPTTIDDDDPSLGARTTATIRFAEASAADEAGSRLPTLAATNPITIDNDNLSIGASTTVTIRFAEAIAADSFSTSDLSVGGYAKLSSLHSSDGGTTWTVTLTAPTERDIYAHFPSNIDKYNSTGNQIRVNLAGVSTPEGNAGVGQAVSTVTYDIDAMAPSVIITLGDDALTAGETTTVIFSFNEPITGFDADDLDLTQANGTLGPLTALAGDRTWTATFTPTANVHTIGNKIIVKLDGVADFAGNRLSANILSGNYSIDTRPGSTNQTSDLSAGVTLTDGRLMTGEKASLIIAFNKPVNNFTLDDVDGTRANGTLSDLTRSADGRTWTATFTPTAGVIDETNTIRVNLAGVSDAAGTAATGSATSGNFIVSTALPAATITLTDTAFTTGETATVTFTFNQPVLGFTLDDVDLTQANGTLSAPAYTPGTDSKTWTATFTPNTNVNAASNTIRVNLTGVANMAGRSGTDAAISENYTVDTRPPDTTAPVFSSAAVTGNQLVISYTETNTLDAAALAGNAGYVVRSTTNTGLNWIYSVSSAVVHATNKTVTLTLSRAVTPTETVNVSYTKPATGAVVQDATGNDAANFSNLEVTNIPPAPADTTPPVLSSAVVNGNQLVLTYVEATGLDGAALVGNAGFTVHSAAGRAMTVTGAVVNRVDKSVTLMLSRTVVRGETVSASYVKPGAGNVVQDAAGNDAVNFSNWAVTNNTPEAAADTTPPVFSSATVRSNQLVIDYTEQSDLDDAALARNAGFSVKGYNNKSSVIWIISIGSAVVNATAKTVTLTLLERIAHDDRVTVSYFKPWSGNGVQDAKGNKAANFEAMAVTNNAPAGADTTAPVLDGATVNGNQLLLTYTEAENLSGWPLAGNAGFTVRSAGGTAITVTGAVMDATRNTVTLTLSRAVAYGETVSVSYVKPGVSNVVQDAAGNDTADFSNRAVTNVMPAADTTPPVFSGAAINGDQLVLTYMEANSLDAAALAGNAGHTVNTAAGTTAITVSRAVVNAMAKTVTLILSRAVASAETVLVSYTKPATGAVVQDAAGNDAANFRNLEVTNTPPTPTDTTPPVLNSATVNGDQLVLTYIEASSLDGAALAGNAGFTVRSAAGRAMTVTGAMVHGADRTVTLTLSRTVVRGETVSASYVKPGVSNVVQDAAGNDAVNFSHWAVTNDTPEAAADTTPPVFSSATVRSNQLVIHYTEQSDLDDAALARNAGFSVKGYNNKNSVVWIISVGSAVVNATAKTVTLTLLERIAQDDRVTVSYFKPWSGNVVQDAKGNKAANFEAMAVTNNSPAGADTTAPVLGSATVNGNQLVLTYTEAENLSARPLAGNAGFTVSSAGGAAITVTGAVVDATRNTVTLTLSRAVTSSETVTLSHTRAGVEDVAGNDTADFSNRPVTNVTPAADTTPPVFSHAMANDDQLVISYTEQNSLAYGALSGDGGFAVHLLNSSGVATERLHITSAVVNAMVKTVTLTFEDRTVGHGESVSVSYTKPESGNVVQDAAGNHAANFEKMAATNYTLAPADTTPPVISSAVLNVNQLVLTYTEANSLDAAALADNAGFTLNTAAGTRAIIVSRAVVNATAKTVTLTLSRTVASAETVTVSYTKPGSGAVVQDVAGNDAANFSNRAMSNDTPAPPDTTPPQLIITGDHRPKVTGDQLVLSFSDTGNLDADRAHTPASGAFTVLVNGVANAVTHVSVEAGAKTVTLTLSTAVSHGQSVTVAYADPTTGNDANAIQDAAGNDATSFAATEVSNNTPDTTPPQLIITGDTTRPKVSGDQLVLSFSDTGNLDADRAHTPASGAFTVLVNGVANAVTHVTVEPQAKTVTLTLSTAVSHGQSVTVAYADPTTGNDANAIQDAAGNDAASFAATAVSNNTPDTTPPQLIITGDTTRPKVSGHQLVLSFSDTGNLDADRAHTPASGAFTVLVNGVANAVTHVTVEPQAKTVTLTLSTAVSHGQSVTVAYADPTTGNDANAIQDAAGNDAASFAATAVSNNTPDTTPPQLIITGDTTRPKVSGHQLVLSFSDTGNLDADRAHTPASGAFTVLVNGVANAVTHVTVEPQAKTVTLTLSTAVSHGQSVTVAYADPTTGNDANAIQDAAGNDAASFAATAVSNNTPDTTPPQLIITGDTTRPQVNGDQLVLSFSDTGNLDADASHTPASGAFTVLVNGVANAVTHVTVEPQAKTVTLTLSTAVSHGQSVTVAYADPTTGNDANAIQDAAGNDAASFAATAVSNNTPDTTPPQLIITGDTTRPQVSGHQLVLSFSDTGNLDADRAHTPASGAFTVLVNGVANAVTHVTVEPQAKTVTLTLSTAVSHGQSVTVAYADPTTGNDANAIQDAAGNDAASFAATAVSNNTPDTTPPQLIITGDTTRPQVNGDQLVLSFSDTGNLDADASHTPASGAFTVLVNGVANAVTHVTVEPQAKTVTLTLSTAVSHGQSVTVAYADPTTGNDANAIQDAAGNDAASFAATAVSNNTPDTTPPQLIITGDTTRPQVNGDQLVLSFSDTGNLDADASHTPASGAFTVLVNGVANAVTHVTVEPQAKTVTLTLSTAVSHGQSVTVAYADPTTGNDANAIQDAAGNDAASFAATAVSNNTPDTTPPQLIITGDTTRPQVNGDQLVLSFSDTGNLDADASHTPASGAFTVLVNGVANAVTHVTVEPQAKTVTLTLSTAVSHGQSVIVVYADPTTGNDTNAIQDAAGNDAASFAVTAVSNNTPAPADTTPPEFHSATVNGDQLVLTYTEANTLDAAALAGNAGFTVSTAAGTAAITVSSAVVNATAKTVTLTLSRAVARTETLTVSYTKPESGAVVQDAAGNDAANFSDRAVTHSTSAPPDTQPPTLAATDPITIGDDKLHLGESTTVTIRFSEDIDANSFSIDDLNVGAGAQLTNLRSTGGGTTTWEVTLTAPGVDLTPVSSSTGNKIRVNLAQITDLAGNAGVGTAVSTVSYDIDAVPPRVSITLADDSLTSGETTVVSFSFTEAVRGFDASKIDLSNANGTLGPLTASAEGKTWTATFTPTENVNDVRSNTIGVNMSGVRDLAGNAATTSPVTSAHYTVNTRSSDGVAVPTATITLADTTLRAGETTTVTFRFSETVSGFSSEDIVLTDANGTLGELSAGADGRTWSATFTPTATVEDAGNSIGVNMTGVRGAATGRAGVGITHSANYSIDTKPPTLAATQPITLRDDQLHLGESTSVTIRFSEDIDPDSFSTADLSVEGGARLSNLRSTGDGTTLWEVTLTAPESPSASSTTGNKIRVNLAGITDRAGNAGVGTADSTVRYDIDTERPHVSITLADSSLTSGETTTVSFRFNEAVSGFDASRIDLSNANGTLGPLTAGADGKTWTATFTPRANVDDASNTIGVNMSGVRDQAGNSTTGTITSANYTVDTRPDTTAPALITTGDSRPQVTGNQLVLSFSDTGTLDASRKPESGAFTVLVNGVANAVTNVSVEAQAKTVTLTLSTAVTSDQTVTVAYADPTTGNDANAIQDTAGNDAASFAATAVTNNTPAPAAPPPVGPVPAPPPPSGGSSGGSSAPAPGPYREPDTDGDSVPDAQENQAIGPTGAALGDGNGDNVQDRTQAAVASYSATTSSSSSTSVTLVADSQEGKVNADSTVRITSLVQKATPTPMPQALETPIALTSFKATLDATGSSETFSLYVDPKIGANGYWAQDSTGIWVNLASSPYGGKMASDGGRLRLDFAIQDGGPFDADGQANGAVTASGAAAQMPLSITGQASDVPREGFWF